MGRRNTGGLSVKIALRKSLILAPEVPSNNGNQRQQTSTNIPPKPQQTGSLIDELGSYRTNFPDDKTDAEHPDSRVWTPGLFALKLARSAEIVQSDTGHKESFTKQFPSCQDYEYNENLTTCVTRRSPLSDFDDKDTDKHHDLCDLDSEFSVESKLCRLDYLSLSLSPLTLQKEEFLYPSESVSLNRKNFGKKLSKNDPAEYTDTGERREAERLLYNKKPTRCFISISCPPRKFSFTSPKNVEDMDRESLHQIVENENNCTSSQEDPNSYGRGGYMPISEGDVLTDNYKVCRKLGYGQFSTVWLCQDQTSSDYVAIKVSKSRSNITQLAKDEIKLLKRTNSTNPRHNGFKNIVQMFHCFSCQSVNGNHTAIVLEVMGPSLLHLIKQSEYCGIQLPGVRRIIKQVLEGLEYLHDECGIIHTDIKPENILIKASEPYIRQMVSTAKRLNELGIALPKTYVSSERWTHVESDAKDEDVPDDGTLRIRSSKSYPDDPFLSELVSFRKKHIEPKLQGPMWIDPNIEVKIGDMGNATTVDNRYDSIIQTRQYRALEVILGAGYYTPADIWSVGCLAFELATGEFLFYPKIYNNLSMDVDHITLIWEVLGSIPKYVTESGAKGRSYFLDGKLKHIDESQLRIWKIEDVLVDKYKWKRLDAIPFAGFIESLIEPDPSLRYTAAAALSSEWINE